MFLQSLLALMATYWFGIILNVKKGKLIFASIGGGIGWFVFVFSLSRNVGSTLAYFLASIALTMYSEAFAKILKTPTTTLLIPGLIPLVPGAGIFYTMLYSVQGTTDKALTKGIETIFAACALAFGIVFVSSISRIIKDIKSGNRLK